MFQGLKKMAMQACIELNHNRDQSYFLFNTTQEQLDFEVSLGEIDKSETRSIAKKLNLNVAEKPDSQDICFVPNGDYSSVIKNLTRTKKGKIIDLNGNQIRTQGIINYTIGQRKGIKAKAKPLYVVNINVTTIQLSEIKKT